MPAKSITSGRAACHCLFEVKRVACARIVHLTPAELDGDGELAQASACRSSLSNARVPLSKTPRDKPSTFATLSTSPARRGGGRFCLIWLDNFDKACTVCEVNA